MPKLKLLAILLFILVVSAPVSLGHAQVAPEVVVSQHPVLGDILTDAGREYSLPVH